MVVIKLTIDIYGETFIPTDFIEVVKDKIRVVYLDNSYNTVSLEKPIGLGVNNILEYEKWYVDFLNEYYNCLVKMGVERIDLFINVFFCGQCNFEIFSNQMLRSLSLKNISLPISIFKLSQIEIKSLLSDYDYSDFEIEHYFREESN